MGSRIRIQCINKTDRYNAYERIRNIGGINDDGSRWKLTLNDAISYIENGTYSFYVSQGGATVDVIVASNNGYKYLKTRNDDLHPNNLLSLPECP
ncbi:DUF3892 domain-containing protein [Siphonobacter sp. SORGH_AS_0500]|uniref:DUF3892 domain-containing protein n=1 Tax=Siphonobacter sp. SORGH_AS_0500 TaxID=1864824 RepID=UPI002857EA0D|nr:hypothetical protein [Siphonobacter sp. SORGH_AS_0500]